MLLSLVVADLHSTPDGENRESWVTKRNRKHSRKSQCRWLEMLRRFSISQQVRKKLSPHAETSQLCCYRLEIDSRKRRKRFMSDKKALDLYYFRVAHNALLCFGSFVMVLSMVRELYYVFKVNNSLNTPFILNRKMVLMESLVTQSALNFKGNFTFGITYSILANFMSFWTLTFSS